MIASGNPSGRASVDHERKRGLRTSRAPRAGANAAIMYGPVPGGGRPRMSVTGARAGKHIGQRCGELVQKLGVRPAQVDGDRPRRGVGRDALREVTPPRAAGVDTDDGGVERRNLTREAHEAFDRGAEVLGPHRRAVGEPQPAAKLKRVGAPAVGRLRDARGEIGDQRAAAGARDATVGEEAVVGQRQHRPVAPVVARRIEAAAAPGGPGLEPQRPAAMAGARLGRRHPHRPAGERERRRRAPERDAPGHAACPRVDADHGARAAIGHPDRPQPSGDRTRATADAHRVGDRVGGRVDPRDGPVIAVCDPDPAVPGRDRGRPVADPDRPDGERPRQDRAWSRPRPPRRPPIPRRCPR